MTCQDIVSLRFCFSFNFKVRFKFKIKNKGRVLNIPYGSQNVCSVYNTNCKKRDAIYQLPLPTPPPPPLPSQQEIVTPPLASPQPEPVTPPPASPQQEIQTQVQLSPIKEEPLIKENDDAVLLEFFDSMQAVTMGMLSDKEVKNEVIDKIED